MHRRTLITSLLQISLVLALLASCAKQSADNSRSEELRVISLVPSISDQIYELGCEEYLVGCTSYCVRAVADSIPVVSSAVQPNLDLIVAQRPSIVFVSPFISPDIVSALEQAGIRTLFFDNPHSYADIQSDFLRLAEVLGVSDLAEQQLAEINTVVDSLRAVNAARSTQPRTFIQIAFKPLFAATGTSYMNDLIHYCNAINVAEELDRGAISVEYILEQDPEVIFFTDTHGSSVASQEQWQEYTSVSAVRRGYLFKLPGGVISQPTPHHFLASLDTMTKLYSRVAL